MSPECRTRHPNATYDLIANIVHDGEPGPGKGTYRVHILHQGSGKWFELQDLHVVDILPQMITLSESYIQVKLCVVFRFKHIAELLDFKVDHIFYFRMCPKKF